MRTPTLLRRTSLATVGAALALGAVPPGASASTFTVDAQLSFSGTTATVSVKHTGLTGTRCIASIQQGALPSWGGTIPDRPTHNDAAAVPTWTGKVSFRGVDPTRPTFVNVDCLEPSAGPHNLQSDFLWVNDPNSYLPFQPGWSARLYPLDMAVAQRSGAVTLTMTAGIPANGKCIYKLMDGYTEHFYDLQITSMRRGKSTLTTRAVPKGNDYVYVNARCFSGVDDAAVITFISTV